MPDPSTLDADGDDDVVSKRFLENNIYFSLQRQPLNVVQEKAKLDRSASQRATSSSSQSAIGEAKRNQSRDLICDSLPMAPPRPNTTEPAALRSVPPKAEKAPPKHIRPGESLLGLDFLGGGSSTSPVGPASALEGGLPSGSSRPDLKQSILSLYSSAPKSSPKPTPQSQNATQHSHARAESFGAPQGPDSSSQLQFASKEITDAFGGLKFDSTPASSKSTSNFPGLSSYNNSTGLKSSGPGSGGSFFDPPAPKSPPQKPASIVSPDGFGDFLSSTSGADISSKKPAAESLSADLFDFSGNSMSMASQPPLLAASATSSSITSTAGAIDSLSAFNLSSVTNNPAPTVPSNFTKPSVPLNSGFANMDAWGSTDAWSASNEASTTNLPYTSNHTQPKESQPPPVTSTDFNWGGGGGNHSRFSAGKSSPPVITQDEDFGGWNSSEPVDTGKSKQVMTSSTASSFTVNSSASKPVTNFSGDDLFSNVWE